MAYQLFIVGYFMPNPVYTYIKYRIRKHISEIKFLNAPELFFLTQKYLKPFLLNMNIFIYY